jgi:hypothetical protein
VKYLLGAEQTTKDFFSQTHRTIFLTNFFLFIECLRKFIFFCQILTFELFNAPPQNTLLVWLIMWSANIFSISRENVVRLPCLNTSYAAVFVHSVSHFCSSRETLHLTTLIQTIVPKSTHYNDHFQFIFSPLSFCPLWITVGLKVKRKKNVFIMFWTTSTNDTLRTLRWTGLMQATCRVQIRQLVSSLKEYIFTMTFVLYYTNT